MASDQDLSARSAGEAQLSQPANGIVAIGIPLIDRDRCFSWDSVTAVLAHTLLSVFRQTSKNWTLAIACNEVPEGKFFTDPRIRYLVVPKTENQDRMHGTSADQYWKMRALRQWAADSSVSHYFSLDDDDLISNRLIGYLTGAPRSVGFLLREGFACDSRERRLAPLPAASMPQVTFDKWCGSSVVVSLDPSHTSDARLRILEAIWQEGHWHARENFLRVTGEAATEVPFRAALYRLNTGENNYHRLMRSTRQVHISDWIFKSDSFAPDAALRDEFSY